MLKINLLISLVLQCLVLPALAGNIGVGFSTYAPFNVPLSQMKSKGVFILKTWDISTGLLDQMMTTYANVNTTFDLLSEINRNF